MRMKICRNSGAGMTKPAVLRAGEWRTNAVGMAAEPALDDSPSDTEQTEAIRQQMSRLKEAERSCLERVAKTRQCTEQLEELITTVSALSTPPKTVSTTPAPERASVSDNLPYGSEPHEFDTPDSAPWAVPEELLDPITGRILLDPVIYVDGYTYERQYLESWLKTRTTSPRTGEYTKDKTIIPNIQLRTLRQRLVPLADHIERLIMDRSVLTIETTPVDSAVVSPAPTPPTQRRTGVTTDQLIEQLNDLLPPSYDVSHIQSASTKILKKLWSKLCRLEGWQEFTDATHIPGWEDVDGHLVRGQRVLYEATMPQSMFDQVEIWRGSVVREVRDDTLGTLASVDCLLRKYLVQFDGRKEPVVVRLCKLRSDKNYEPLPSKNSIVRIILKTLLAGVTPSMNSRQSFYMTRRAQLCDRSGKKGLLPTALPEPKTSRRCTQSQEVLQEFFE